MIEQQWRQNKRFVHEGGCRSSALRSWLRWFSWESLNGRYRCMDPFLRIVDAIARQFPQS
ncbi:hypothetical protein HPB48_015715 [Haemaphysalis longicornis]|uniref:Uncharacterized protein n=1 Tax=Haemaphysalis longicornis TaxID=44386 RepID=A0A9J6FBQ4_HAELO|nr:hypothetical protein HPB48_015715 [Haemaphysalis longicornis]